MGKNLKQLDYLYVGQNVVSLISKSKSNIRAIEIDYIAPINIKSLLPNGYVLQHNNNKMIILKTQNSSEQLENLFKYKGNAIINNCFLVLSNMIKYKVPVIKNSLEFWNTLIENEDNIKQDWAYIKRNWEDINFTGNNNKKYYLHRDTRYDNETKTFTTTKEIRKR